MPNYIPASAAYKKLNYAYDCHTNVYIYGATGYGKTRMVTEFTKGKSVAWFSCLSEDFDLFLERVFAEPETLDCIVIDDLQFLNDEKQINEVVRLIKNTKAWVVLIGRMTSPQWLLPIMAEGNISVISEKLLRFTGLEVKALFEENDLSIDSEVAEYIVSASDGNVYAIAATMLLYRESGGEKKDYTQVVKDLFMNHLENVIIPQWDIELQEFLMKVSVVDEFTLPLAIMITGDDRAANMISEASMVGNFLTKEGEIYRLREQLRVALRNRAVKFFGLNEFNRYICNAALFYETKDDILTALKLYEQCEKKDSIRNLLIRNGRRHAGAGHYYALRNYYLSLSEEEIETSPVLMSAMSLLYSILLNPEKSEYWYEKLKEFLTVSVEGGKKEVNALLLYLDISLPHRGSINMVDIMKHAFTTLSGGGFKFTDLSVTNNGPSAMNGGKDFCEWTKKDQFLADTVGKIIEKLCGDMGRGLVHVALCESFYQKGNRDADAAHQAMLANLDIEGGGKLEVLFVAVAVQVRLNVISGNLIGAYQMLDAFEEKVRESSNEALKTNFKAFRCRIDMATGKTSSAESWLMEAPNELIDFCVLDRYRYMTKALCYIQLGMNNEAIEILSKMRYYAEMYQRTYIFMETGLLLSIVSRRNKGEWKELLLATLVQISEYRFVRIISEKGAGILPLLKEIKKDYLALKKADSTWFNEVLKETESIVGRYPSYLSCTAPQPGDFSELDIEILELQADGLSVKEIAAKLDMSERAIKYHASENYKKLNANGKTDAVQIAKKMQLI